MTSLAIDEVELIREVTKASYFDFLKEFWETFCQEKPSWNWHIEYICNEIQEVCERIFRNEPKLYDLVINICPGSTKSSAASIGLVPWLWTRMPSLRSINGSHTHNLVLNLSRLSREIIMSEKYQKCFPEVILSDSQNTKDHYVNTKGGGRLSCTISGITPTGFHAHLHVVDDPIDPAKAKSDAEIDTANYFINEVLSTRMVDKEVTPLILIMQRLAQNDPTGYLEEKYRDKGKIKNICIPAEITDRINPPELKARYIDGLMDPKRVSQKVLEDAKGKGDYFYAGQYLQNPIPLGGGMFKTDALVIHKGDIPGYHNFKKIIRYWDNAGSPGKSKRVDKRRAYTVGVKMGLHKDGSFWVLDVIRDRFSTDKREETKVSTAHKDGQHVKIVQEQEGGSGGQESAEYTIRRLAGFSISIDIPRGDKGERADTFSAQVNIGNVRLVEAPWNHIYIEEMKYFPYSAFKDQIDASSGAFQTIFKLRKKVGAF